jgi:hypothetical protein
MLRWWVNYQFWKQDTLRFEYRVLLIILLILAGVPRRWLVFRGARVSSEMG